MASQPTDDSATAPGGRVPVAAFQPTTARRLLTILATMRPIPPAAAHASALGHEKRAAVGSNAEVGSSLRIAWYRAPDERLGE